MPDRLPGQPLRPRIDLIERASDYRLFLDLPGSAVGDVHLDIRDGVLRVTTRLSARARLDGASRPHEPQGLQLNVDFGDLLSGDELQAVHEQGVLLVTLPKA